MTSKNSDFWKSESFVALDIETTGLDPQKCEIIEIGAVKFNQGKETEQFTVLVKPSEQVPTFIKQLTGINETDLEKGVSIKTALTDLSAFLKEETILCHNSSFDVDFIQHHLTLHRLPSLSNPVYDTLELSRIYFPFLNSHKLSTVADALQIESPRKYHRALNDALITGKVFIKLTEFVLEYIPFELNTSLLELAEFAEQSSDLERYFKLIVAYQRRFALITRKADDYHRVYQSPLCDSLNFNKSHNLIRSDDWFEKKEENLTTLLLSEESGDSERKESPDSLSGSIVEQAFAEEGFFAQCFPEYEYRQGQVLMADSIEKALNNDEFLIVEAGTGIGKTLAYLVTSLHFAYKRGQRVFISTNTKNLQEQLFFKDLAIIKKSIPIPFQAVILKGRDNYLCIRKWNEIRMSFRKLLTATEAASFINLLVWQRYTRSGDISENTSLSRESNSESRRQYSAVWRKLAAERYFCSGRKCSEYNRCYYMSIRQKAEKSSLIVTNHSLLLTDLSIDRFGNEENNYLVIDEAHNLPDMAAGYLGISVSYTDIVSYFQQLAHINIRRNLQTGILPGLKAAVQKSVIDQQKKSSIHADIDYIILSLDDKKQLFAEFFRNIGEQVTKNGSFGKLRIKQPDNSLIRRIEELIAFLSVLHGRLYNLTQFMMQISKSQISDHEEHQDKLTGALEKVRDLTEALQLLKEPDFNNNALWYSHFTASDQFESNYPTGIINYAPLDVSEQLRKILYSRMKSLIFTSATLSLRNSFKFFSSRLGITGYEEKKVEELIIPSPFDYDKQTLVLAANYLPPPADEYFTPQSINLLKMSIDSAEVGSMVLFTSYKDLNIVYDKINDELYKKNILLLAQGKGYSRTVMLNEFKGQGNAVLLGTSSFWEGVDVPGESLSLLILYKLPFQVPTEPLIEAYYEKLKREGKDPFMHSTLPNAMLRFRQGFGRLIRNNKDRGVILVVDSRIVNKRYGRFFLEILPTKIYSASTPAEICDLIANFFHQ